VLFDLPAVVGPGIALAVVAILALVLRWAYSGDEKRPDFGLLTEVTTVDGTAAAREVGMLLSDAGIRSTMSRDPTGRIRVLVFHSDADRARDLVREL
jgi:hypothetical protein